MKILTVTLNQKIKSVVLGLIQACEEIGLDNVETYPNVHTKLFLGNFGDYWSLTVRNLRREESEIYTIKGSEFTYERTERD